MWYDTAMTNFVIIINETSTNRDKNHTSDYLDMSSLSFRWIARYQRWRVHGLLLSLY